MVEVNVDEKTSYLGGILKRIDNFDMNSFDNRLIFQKTVYLIEAFGIHLGCGKFSWYLRGPYSSELAKIGFNLGGKYAGLKPSNFVDETIESKFKQFLEFIQNNKQDSDYLELVASIHWLKSKNPNQDDDTITQYLMSHKPQIDSSKYEKAWNDLRKYNLI